MFFDPVSLAGKCWAVCRASQNNHRLPAKDRRARLCAMGSDPLKVTQFPAPQPPPLLLTLPLSSPAPSLPQPRPPDASKGGIIPGSAGKLPWASGFRVLAGLGLVQPKPLESKVLVSRLSLNCWMIVTKAPCSLGFSVSLGGGGVHLPPCLELLWRQRSQQAVGALVIIIGLSHFF